MENVEFVNILNDIKNIEYSFRNIKKEVLNGKSYFTGPDILKKEYDYVLCFLIYLKYESIVDFSSLQEEGDLEKCLQVSPHAKAEGILWVWKELFGKYPYIAKLLKLLNKYDFTPFNDKVHKDELRNWGYEKLLQNNIGFSDLNIISVYNVIFNCQKHLGIDMEKGNILLIIDDDNIINSIMLNNPQNVNFYMHNCQISLLPIQINKCFFDSYNNIHLSKELSERKYDGIIIYKRRKEDTVAWNEYEDKLNDGGFCLALFQEMSSLPDVFYKYEIPLLIETNKFNILLRKVEDKSGIVRYGWLFNDSSLFEDTYTINKMTECVKNNINWDYFQILNKEGFRYTGKIHFKEVKRLPDQINFIWKKVDDIISIKEDNKWLWDVNVPEDKIIKYSSLSDNPYKINISKDMYLSKEIYTPKEEKHVLDECEIKRVNKYECGYKIPSNYVTLFEKCYSAKEMDVTCKAFDKALCCRVITHPGLLYQGGRILRVKASPERPVCYKNYIFFFDEDCIDISCQTQLSEIEIDHHYDENFIIYQLLQRSDVYSEFMLVAPTKEEQHTYFLNKRLDYLAKYQPIVDEMENEVQSSISESPTYITGIGFKNFRRFVNLPILQLSGVNVFVGGNNAGKSTLVKGLLLTLDNIKNLKIDNTDNCLIYPTFKYDTNNYHDVRVGTFDRAYSITPIIDETNPNRRFMTFTLSFAHFTIELVIVPFSKIDTTNVHIEQIKVCDNKRNAHFCFDCKKLRTHVKFTIGNEVVDYSYSGHSFLFDSKTIGGNYISSLIKGIRASENKELSEKLAGKYGFILEIADELERVIRNIKIEYIYAHGVMQKVLFNYNDKNDYMAQTLHDLMLEKIGEVEEEFIRKWLNEFGLGNDYDVHSIGGEAYIIQLKMKEGKMVYLADMGMGSNQLVILILRLAIIIHQYRMSGSNQYRPTIIIEEPEQNMHPAFQSKLAILFKEVYSEYGFNFIVETHSEYLVRCSQVIVAQQKYADEKELKKKCPFKVYYFPSDGNPYEMNYRTDGNFSNEFGKGFYDEANNLLFEII